MAKNPLADKTAKLFITKCTPNKVFICGKLNPQYFAIKNFLVKEDPLVLAQLHDYLQNIWPTMMTMGDLFRYAEQFRKEKLELDNKNKIQKLDAKPYKEYGLDDILNL